MKVQNSAVEMLSKQEELESTIRFARPHLELLVSFFPADLAEISPQIPCSFSFAEPRHVPGQWLQAFPGCSEETRMGLCLMLTARRLSVW